MNYATQKQIVLHYLNTLLSKPVRGKLKKELCDWFENNAKELIGREVEDLWEGTWRSSKTPKLPRDIKTLRQFIGNRKGKFVFTAEINAAIEAFHIAPEHHAVLALMMYAQNIPMLDQLIDDNGSARPELDAGLLGVSTSQFEKYVTPSSELRMKGLISPNRRYDGRIELTDMFKEVVRAHCRTPEAVKKAVLGKPMKATLRPEHFEHLHEEYGWLKTLLSNALKKKQRGVNVLLYGKPGTGKSELAKTLCQEIGVPLFAVSGNSPAEHNSSSRRHDLACADCVLENDRNSILLMDEAEDVFGAASNSGIFFFQSHSREQNKSKMYFHKLLENNNVPVIWISNSIDGVDPAHLRRFAYALKMESPDETVQQRIWQHTAKKHKVKLPENRIRELTKIYDIAPAIIDTSLRTAALTNDNEAIEKTIESLQTAMYGRVSKKETSGGYPFSTALLNCDMDLETLTGQIKSLSDVNFSLCLYGIPGSGKSAYARHLADELKMKVLVKRASDLLSMWVGGSEQNIAAAFAEARKKKMLLVIDEADSFLQDRRNAQRSWEVTQVNEMLTQMESHPLPFVCTTNLMDNLDQASLRRFTFKVKYDYLKQSQVREAFKHFFGGEPAVSLNDLTCLAPGDFVVVSKKATIMNISDHKTLTAMLRQEQAVKDEKTNFIGFGR